MKRKSIFLFPLLIFGFIFASRAQVVSLPCPVNSDFEQGNYTNWVYYYGTCCGAGGPGTLEIPYLTTTAPAAAYIPCEFALTGLAAGGDVLATSVGIDPFGGFPVVGAGNYSLRIGSTRTDQWAEKAEYYVHVPSGVPNYSLIYKYAVVLENPSHPVSEQPRFDAIATDSASGLGLPCATFNYVSGALPTFVGPVNNSFGAIPAYGCADEIAYAINTWSPNHAPEKDVYYQPWLTASINLSGYGGHTIIMSFSAGDCDLGGHFGYGYVDMTCGTFAINNIGCGDTIATVSAPSGFANYSWYDSLTFTILYGTTQTVTFPMPGVPTTYAVIMSPYTGFGCPDTLYTHVQPSNLQLHPSNDTLICNGQSAILSTGATDVALPLSYVWSPTTSLSCGTCATTVATPFAGVNVYTFTVTDASGCFKTDSIKVTVDSVASTITNTPASCFGFADGSATVTPTSGIAPYLYSWNTVPTQTVSIATHLAYGTYIDTITDSKGCSDTASTNITQPALLTMAITAFNNPTTCGGGDGTITLSGFSVSVATPFVIRYLFAGIAHTETITASATGVLVIPNLFQGTYDSISVVTTGCPYNIVGPVTLSDPPLPALPFVSSNSPICDSTTLQLTTSDVTAGVTYSWSGPQGFTSTSQIDSVPNAQYADSGYYVVTVTVNNCVSKDSAKVIVNHIPWPVPNNNSPICSGDTIFLTGNYVHPGGADSYVWGGPNGFASNLQNPWIANAQAVTAGAYTLTVTYKGCSDTASTTVTINQTPAAPVVTDTNYCQYTLLVPPLSATGDSLAWHTVPTGGADSFNAPIPGTSDTGVTTWYVSQTLMGCISLRAAQTVYVAPFPSPTFTMSDSVFCNGTNFTFTATGANTGSDYSGITWYFGGDSVQNVNPVMYAFDGSGPTVVSANIYYNVCPDTILSHTVMVYPYPVVNLGADTSICPGGDPITFTDIQNMSNPAASWLWSTGQSGPSITIVAPGVYYCKVTINGCSTSDTVNVLNNCYMDIPNVFTPNGDGVNDYFYPRQFLTKGLTSFNMNIYNRWGQLVFTTTSIDGRGWDGTFNGVPQPEGVFVYVINATFEDGQKQHRQGNVTLLR